MRLLVEWPLLASMAAVFTAQGLLAGRRRGALNQAVHEVRRPLQALALATSPPGRHTVAADSVDLAATALERLDREINGGRPPVIREPVCCRRLLRAAIARWKARASLEGASLMLRWEADVASVEGDGAQLAQALDNLIVNAIEHGGGAITVEASSRAGRLRIAVLDSGSTAPPKTRRGSPHGAVAWLTGRHRRGHGLAVVRRVASDHDGRFALRRHEKGSAAVLELPLA